MAESVKTYRIVISGYYGFHNSGDEAVLRSILLALQEQGERAGIIIHPIVLSADPVWTSKMYNVESVPRMHPASLYKAISTADGLISGGGSLLQDATSAKSVPYYTGIIKLAQWLKKPTFIYAQGIGPVQRRWLFPLIKSAMRGSAYISVRDEQSAAFLRQIGVTKATIEVVPDPVMGMPLPMDNQPEIRPDDRPIIGVSVRNWRQDQRDLDEIGQALGALMKEQSVRIRFLPFHTPDDIQASEYIMNKLQAGVTNQSTIEIINGHDNPQQMLVEVSRCDVLFGMRLHALIYAANQSVPLIGLSYDPKIDQFLKRLDTIAVGSTESLNAEQFTQEIVELLRHKEQWKAEKSGKINQLIEQSQKPAQQISRYLRQNISR